MLKRIAITSILTLICLCFLSYLYGQVPTPTKTSNKPQNQTATSQEQAKIISDATQGPVARVPLPVTPNTEKETADNTKKENSKSSADWWLVYFTGALVIVVSLQLVWMIRQEKWMRANVEILTSTQRPFVSMKEIIIHKVLSDPGKVSGYGFVVRLENSGNTPAIKMSFQITRKISESSTVPLSADYTITKIQDNTLGARSTIDVTPIDIPIDDIINICNLKKFLYIYGIITFTDVMKNIYIEKFCREVGVMGDPSSLQPGTPIFTFSGQPTDDDGNKK